MKVVEKKEKKWPQFFLKELGEHDLVLTCCDCVCKKHPISLDLFRIADGDCEG